MFKYALKTLQIQTERSLGKTQSTLQRLQKRAMSEK